MADHGPKGFPIPPPLILLPETRLIDTISPKINKIKGKMQNSLIFFGGKNHSDSSLVLSQFTLPTTGLKEGVKKEIEHSSGKKSFRMTNGWTSSRSLHQEYKFHRASGSLQDKPIENNKIGSSLLGGKLHINRDLLSKPNPKTQLSLSGHKNCITVQTLPLTDRPKQSPPIKDYKKSLIQEDRVSEGLTDIFDKLTGQNFRRKMNTVPTEEASIKGTTPPRTSARRIVVAEDEE